MTKSTLDSACDAFVQDIAALVPTAATAFGIAGFDGELEDFSPEFYENMAQRTKQLLDVAQQVQEREGDSTSNDAVTARVLQDRLGIELELHHRGEDLRDLNNIASPLQRIRDTFSLMPRDTAEQREMIASRESKVPRALAGYRESLSVAASRGQVAAARQVEEVAKQAEQLAGEDSLFADVKAREACGNFATWLRESLLPKAPSADGVGRERYELFSHQFVGARVDLDDAYVWAQERLREISAEQDAIAAQLYGAGTSAWEAMNRLDEEERYTLHGVDALQRWMQETADKAVSDLHGTHFDIPEPVRTIECCIDPAGTGGIFYTPPADDFSRPGRMWWSVPEGEDTFHTWKELTTVYHEGVPGHHLQLGATICNREQLNLWRRVACWNSGHGEGWALYAEQLMAELGYHDDPGTRMGMLDAQRMRAARVMLDIGVHLGKKNPEGGQWSFEYADRFFAENVSMAAPNRYFELMRYFGWPGQAPSYALGQRLWMQLRDHACGHGMDVKDFHALALAQGSLPMGILRDVIDQHLSAGE